MTSAQVRLGLQATLLAALAGCLGEKTGGDSAGTTTTPGGACAGSTPILLADGASSGFEKCADGSIHRVTAVTAEPNLGVVACAGTEEQLDCTADTMCPGAHARCASGSVIDWKSYTSHTACQCVNPCASDADCSTGQTCLPPGVHPMAYDMGTCVSSNCATDADCASGECGLSVYDDGCGYQAVIACRDGAMDSCRVDTDCKASDTCAVQLYGDEKNVWACHGTDCAIGRPLLVDNAPRTAPAVARGGWQRGLEPVVPAEAHALAEHWLRVAALEQASVASFARFTLELLSLGAPAELVAEAQRAAVDEVRHAEICYGLASAYAGRAMGPGPLDISGVAPRQGAQAILDALVEEACVGETLGAAEALEAASLARDPVVRAALEEIAEDEARHAALAWKTVQWMLASFPGLRIDLEGALARLEIGEGEGRPEHGVLGALERQAVHRWATLELVRPCAAVVGAA